MVQKDKATRKAQPNKIFDEEIKYDILTEAVARKLENLHHDIETVDHLAAYVSPQRGQIWIVQGLGEIFGKQLKRVAASLHKKLELSKLQVVEFASPRTLVGVSLELIPLEGDLRWHKFSRCDQRPNPCKPYCRPRSFWDWPPLIVKDDIDPLPMRWSHGNCVDDIWHDCWQHYVRCCVRYIYSDPFCQDEKTTYSIYDWICFDVLLSRQEREKQEEIWRKWQKEMWQKWDRITGQE